MTKSIVKVGSAFGITEYRLANGLRVLYKKESAAPVVAVCVTFHVGSRNESKGVTGSTHILEHLLFKDTIKFNKANGNAITDYLEWFGALMNATTWLDRTNYFELIPKERMANALEMEADRLRGSLFNDTDLASEMTVVRNEFERSRNNPLELLDEEVLYKVFTKHPYRIPTIGLKEDIESSTATKLRKFYDVFYWPNNATLSVFGDVEWKDVEREVLTYFAPIPHSPHSIPTLTIVEPKQKSARKVTIKKDMGVNLAMVSYKVPPGTHKDYPAVLLLSTILAGGYSSRMEQHIVDKGIASEVSVLCHPLFDTGAVNFMGQCAEGVKPTFLAKAIEKEIEIIINKGVTTVELAYARERVLSQGAASRDGVFNEIRAVSESVAAGDWALAYKIEKAGLKVTVSDIKRIAKKYFNKQKQTVGLLDQ
ncbi:MAG TPA: pitrilysin family protein [Candidatus Paceibacterota bacterium]|nr:pitrilysin family protein [Candidatus Paceibacterota bacterium]